MANDLCDLGFFMSSFLSGDYDDEGISSWNYSFDVVFNTSLVLIVLERAGISLELLISRLCLFRILKLFFFINVLPL